MKMPIQYIRQVSHVNQYPKDEKPTIKPPAKKSPKPQKNDELFTDEEYEKLFGPTTPPK
jgi:hypothetical protein